MEEEFKKLIEAYKRFQTQQEEIKAYLHQLDRLVSTQVSSFGKHASVFEVLSLLTTEELRDTFETVLTSLIEEGKI